MAKKVWAWLVPLIVVIIILAIIGIWYGASKKQTTPTTKEPIKIGFIGPLTGDAALYGIPPKQGAELAVEEINMTGGINSRKVELIVEDSQCDPKLGVSIINKLIEVNKVKVIIGDVCSSVTMAMAPIAERNKVILFSPQSAAPQIKNAGDFIFRNWPSSDKEGEIAANLAFTKLKLKNSVIVFINNDYGVGIKNAFKNKFEEIGGNVLFEEGVPQGATDFRTITTKIKNKKPDFIYLDTYLKEGADFLKQAKELGLSILIMGPDSLHDEELIKIAGDAAEGLIVTTPIYDPNNPDSNIQSFVKKYRDKYGKVPNNYAAHGYDAMMIIARAISEVGYNTERIKDYFYQLKDYPGISGTTSFNEYGDVIKPFTLKTIKNGQFVSYEE